MFHLRFGLSDHLKALLDFVFGSRRRVKKVRIFRAWFSHCSLGETTSEYRAEHTQSNVPNVRCNIKLPGQSIDVEHLLQRFPTVLRGIVQGVFRQQAGGAWFPSRDLKLAITVLMPQSSEPHHWFGAVACRGGSWPMELPNPRPLLSRLRHLSMSPHLWGTLDPDWTSGLWKPRLWSRRKVLNANSSGEIIAI